MTKLKFKFKNGQEVRDVISGFSGIIDCSAHWINGCVRYSVQPRVDENNKKSDSFWFDEETLELMSEGIRGSIEPLKTGGPSFKSNEKGVRF